MAKAAKQDRESISLADVTDPVNALYYGPGGTGKTTALAAMANLGRVLFINAESGIKARPLRNLGIKIENIELFPRPGESLDFDVLEDRFWQIKSDLQDDPDSWAGTVWDSLSEIYKLLLDQIVEYQVEKSERTGKSRLRDADPGDLIDRFFIDRSDYGVMTEQVRLLVRRFRDLPCHFGISALERREQDDDGMVVYQPAVNPALQNDVFGYMDIVLHTESGVVAGVEEYRGTARAHGKYRGKDRFGALPRMLVTPWFDRIVSYVEDELDVRSDPIMVDAQQRREEVKKRRQEKEGADSD